jgi:hypothetical protein
MKGRIRSIWDLLQGMPVELEGDAGQGRRGRKESGNSERLDERVSDWHAVLRKSQSG